MKKILDILQQYKTTIILLIVAIVIILSLINNYQEANHFYYTKRITDASFYVTGDELVEFYLGLLKSRYIDYPWIIEISDSITIFSIVFTIIALISISISMYKSKRFDRYYAGLQQKYHEKLKEICTSSEGFTTNEIKKMLNISTTNRLKDWEIRAWMKFFMNVKLDIQENYSQTNMYEAINAIDMRLYIAQTFDSLASVKQTQLLQFLIVLRIFVSNSQLLRLKTSTNKSLRRLSYIYCMMANVDDPYTELLYSDSFVDLSHWHKMELHTFFGFLKREKRKMPSFRAILQNNENTGVAPFFIEEAAYWGDDEDINHLTNYFHSPLLKSRVAAFDSMAIRKYIPAEAEMISLYDIQPEVLRRRILLCILAIHSGTASDFFVKAYKEAPSGQTKRVALHCMMQYNEESLSIFNSLKLEAMSDELFNFEHAENRLINNHFYQLEAKFGRKSELNTTENERDYF